MLVITVLITQATTLLQQLYQLELVQAAQLVDIFNFCKEVPVHIRITVQQ